MQRRTVLKQLILASGTIWLMPYCRQDPDKSSRTLKKITVTGTQEKLIEELSEQIIPATDTPGAKAIGAHLFILTIVNDCYKKEDRQKFIAGLKAFEAKTDNEYRTFFYDTVRKLTVEAYTTSQFYLTNIHTYQLVPGHYYGCVPVRSA